MKVAKFFPQIKTENKIQTKKSKEARKTAAVSTDSDRVELSAGSMDVQKIQEVLQQTPDVRTEQVEALKARVDSGEYQVEPQQVADRMLADLLPEDLTNI